MAFPYKESLIYFENLNNKQIPMFTDSCDVGVKVSKEELAIAREHLRNLKKFYGGNNWVLESSYKQAAVNNIIIPIEQHDTNTYACTVLSVNCSSEFKKYHNHTGEIWLSINIVNRAINKSEIASMA